MSKESKKSNKGTVIALVIIAIIIIGGIFWFIQYKKNQPPSDLEVLASCLADKGYKFYGAYWCPHCQNQKLMFGDGKDELPYVECAEVGGDQTQVCKDNKIEGYPTWISPDGTRFTGEQEPASLAQRSQCPYPGGATDSEAEPAADEGATGDAAPQASDAENQ